MTWGQKPNWTAILYDDHGIAIAQIGDARTEKAAIEAMTKLANRINPAKPTTIARHSTPTSRP